MARLSIEDNTDSWQQRAAALRARGLPRHIAIIMDGNGRWARRRGLPRVAGHKASVDALRDVIAAAGDLGIEFLTLYAFSTENWKRPRSEVDALMNLLVDHVHSDVDELDRQGVRIEVIGKIAELPAAARDAVLEAVARTSGNKNMVLVLALNYGGRQELTEAVIRLAKQVETGHLSPERIDEQLIASALYTARLPDPDLLIRTSGELRLSNFLLWQSAYTEFWVTDVCWPDFRRSHLVEAIESYQRRERRFGGLIGEPT